MIDKELEETRKEVRQIIEDAYNVNPDIGEIARLIKEDIYQNGTIY